MQTCFQTLVGLEPEIDNNLISEWIDRVMNECSNEKSFAAVPVPLASINQWNLSNCGHAKAKGIVQVKEENFQISQN